MTSTIAPASNGRMRKTLASQLDRLDHILDGLSEGLNEAVAAAVKEAVGIAVRETLQAVLTEVLPNLEALATLHEKTPESEGIAKKPSRSDALRQWLTGARQRITIRLRVLGQSCLAFAVRVKDRMVAGFRQVLCLGRFKRPLFVALLVGAGMSTAAFWAGPWLSAAVSGVGGFAGSVGVQIGLWLRRNLTGRCAVRS